MPEGIYRVQLHFCDLLYNGGGIRRFDVLIEERVLEELSDLDTGADGIATPMVRRVTVPVEDGVLDIRFVSRLYVGSTISAIEIERLE